MGLPAGPSCGTIVVSTQYSEFVFCPVAQFAAPHFAGRDLAVHVAENVLGMNAGFQDAMVGADQFLAGIAADPAEIVVGVGDASFHVGNGDDDRLIDRILLLDQFLMRRGRARFGHCKLAHSRGTNSDHDQDYDGDSGGGDQK